MPRNELLPALMVYGLLGILLGIPLFAELFDPHRRYGQTPREILLLLTGAAVGGLPAALIVVAYMILSLPGSLWYNRWLWFHELWRSCG